MTRPPVPDRRCRRARHRFAGGASSSIGPWSRGLLALALLGAGFGCGQRRVPPVRQVPASEAVTEESGQGPGARGSSALAAPAEGPPVVVPCSDYPVGGEEGPYRLAPGSGIDPPRRIRLEWPDLRGLGLEMSDLGGPLILEVLVSETGAIASAVAVRSAHPDFDRLAIAALESARFKPATRNGRTVAVCITVTVSPHP